MFAGLIFSRAGHVVLVGSASPSSIEHPNTALGLLVVSIVIIVRRPYTQTHVNLSSNALILLQGLGAGGIKANVSPMIAEQYTGKLRKKILPSGEVVVVSPAVTVQSIYLWFYAGVNLGSCGAISASFLARDQGYWIAFLVPTCIFMMVPLVLLAGKNNYVRTPPRGSILLETMRVIAMSLEPKWSINPVSTIRAMRAPGLWDIAKPCTFLHCSACVP